MDFEYFRAWLVEGLGYGDGAKGGRPSFDPVMMFKALILQAQHNLLDARMEFIIRDRQSWLRFLGFLLGDRTPDEAEPPAVAYWYSRDRSGVHPQRQLENFTGILQADAYGGYDALYAPGRKAGPIYEAACWAHARRPFYKAARIDGSALARGIVTRMDAIFALERYASAERRLAGGVMDRS